MNNIKSLQKSLFIISVFCLILISSLIYLNYNNNVSLENYKKEIKRNEINSKVLSDSLLVIKEKNKIYYEKLSYNLEDLEELKQYNKSLFLSIKELENRIGDLNTYIQSDLIVNLKDATNSSTITKNDSTYIYDFVSNYKDEGLSYNYNLISKFNIKNNKLEILDETVKKNIFEVNLELGTKIDGDSVKVFAVSKSDKVVFKTLNSVSLFKERPLNKTEKKKQFNLCFYVGYGLGINLKPTPQIGIGISKTIIRF